MIPTTSQRSSRQKPRVQWSKRTNPPSWRTKNQVPRKLLAEAEDPTAVEEGDDAEQIAVHDPPTVATTKRQHVLTAARVAQNDAGDQIIAINRQTAGQNLFEVRHRIDRRLTFCPGSFQHGLSRKRDVFAMHGCDSDLDVTNAAQLWLARIDDFHPRGDVDLNPLDWTQGKHLNHLHLLSRGVDPSIDEYLLIVWIYYGIF